MQRLLVTRPEWKAGKPTAVLIHARDPRRGELIVACCEQGAAGGVRMQMPLAEATALARRLGKFQPLPHDPAADLQALVQLAEACERFSPLVGWKTISAGKASDLTSAPPLAPATLFLDVTGIGVLFGGEDLLTQEVLAEAAARGYRAVVGLAETIAGAWCATFVDSAAEGRASYIIPPGESAEKLSHLPLDTLRLPEDLLTTLRQLGVERIDQLAALPRGSVASRLGELPLTRLDQFFGAVEEKIVAHRPPPKFHACQALEFPRGDLATLDWILTQLVERIAAELHARGEGALELTARFDCAGSPPLFIRLGLSRPTAAPRHLLELVRMRLESLRLPGPVGRIGLQAAVTARLEQQQLELFPDQARAGSRELAVLIDRLSCRLGEKQVVRPQLTADPLPERAYRLTPLAGGTTSRRRSPPLELAPEQRPLRFFQPPQRLQVESLDSEEPPTLFHWQGELQRLARQWGPERIETGWWRKRLLRRDYWRVETTTGERLWLFRDLRDGGWHVAGVFA